MDSSVDSQVIRNTNDREETQRRAFITRVCGEEHNATFNDKTATLYFATDGRLIQMSEFKFKLIFSGRTTQGGITDFPTGFDTYAFQAWLDAHPVGEGINTDGAYGYQCWDYANAFWWAQVNRPFQMFTSHYVKDGILDPASREANAGTEFDMVYEWGDLLPGDWVLFDNSETGHIAMVVNVALNNASNGYLITVRDQNYINANDYVGSPLADHNMSRNGFIGAFRYKKWHQGDGPVIT